MSLTVTATETGSGGTANGIALTVKVITGQAASPIGTAVNSTSVSPGELSITPSGTGSWVYGAVINAGASTAFTAAAGTTFDANVGDTTNFGAYGTFRSTATTTGGTPETLGASAPNSGSGNLVVALLEILKGTGLAEDSSSPASVTTVAASTATTAAFTPPAGSLLVAIVASNASYNGTNSMTMAVTDTSGLTWTRRSTGQPAVGSATYQPSTVWTAPVPGGGNTSTGGLSMAGMAMAGAAAGGNATASGGLSMARAAMAGSGAETFAAAGGLSLASMAMAGSGSVPLPVTSAGGLSLAPVAMAAAGRVPTTASGGLSLAAIDMAGAGIAPVTSSGSLSLAGMSMAAAAAVPAPPFPESPLDLRCELDLGGLGWTDTSSDVYQRDGTSPPVELTRGRADESSQANPGTAKWEWNNRSGKYSPKNPLSPYYGMLGRNTPVRWSVPAQSIYLRLENDNADRAGVNDNTRLHITGSIEMRIALRLTDWQGGVLACKWDGGGCWFWAMNDDGTMTLGWYDSSVAFHSVTSTAPAPFTRAATALRVTLNASTGAVTFSTAAGIGGTYAQLGAVVSATGATSVQNATGSALQVGYSFNITPGQICGELLEYQLWNGISGSGGALAADGVFTAQAAGATSWTDAQGNLWLLAGGAEISDRDYRWHGQMSAQPPKWDVTGADMSVAAGAGGPLRLIGQGQAPAMSPMKRALLAQSGDLAAVALWPCEDLQGSTMIGSAVGGPLMTTSGGTGDGSVTTSGPAFAASTTFLCSNSLPTLNGSTWYGQVPAYASNGSVIVRFLLDLGSVPSGAWAVMRVIMSGTCQELSLHVNTASELTLAGYNSSGTLFSDGPVSMANMPGPVWVSMELRPGAGGTVDYSCEVLAPGASAGYGLSGSYSGSIGNAAAVYVNPSGVFTDTVVGQISVQSAWESLFNLYQPLNAWQGETAGARIARLAAENGWSARVIGSPAASAAMGAQAIDTLGNLLQACEGADRGQIFEPRQALAVGYRILASMYGQASELAVSYPAAGLGGVSGGGGDSGLDPTYDDQLTRNDWTLTRSAGQQSGATYQYQLNDGSPMSISPPPAGVGDYADTLDVNVQFDSQLPDLARWMVHVGTVDEARWPAIPVNLARPETAALYQSALDADIGDMLEIDGAPDLVVYDPVKQLAFQVTEQLGGFHYAITYNAVPESPYEVFQASGGNGPVQTAGTTLGDSVSPTATSLSFVTQAGSRPWTTSAGDFPFDVMIAGERMTVTGIAAETGSATSPAAFQILLTVPLAEGAYTVSWAVTLSGALSGSDADNFGLTLGSGPTIAAPSVNAAAAGTYPQAPVGVTIGPGGDTLVVKSWGNAATSGAVYGAAVTNPQAATVTRSVNGVAKAQAAGAPVLAYPSVVIAL